jgi:hypothetical protein
MKWVPNPGPQTDAYFSKADVLLYGGEPGGGKSQLILGLAFNEHQKSLIMRREYGDLDGIIGDALKIHGSRDGFNGSPPPKLRINERQVISFAAAHRVGDEQGQMGKGRDLIGIDEATHFAKSQIRFLMGWNRTDDPNQRCRVVLATNPPLSPRGHVGDRDVRAVAGSAVPQPGQARRAALGDLRRRRQRPLGGRARASTR